MTQLIAFMKKELLEQLRTGKLLLLIILFFLFGIMNPAIAKLLPWLMEAMAGQLAESGMTITHVEVDALTSWTQFFKNMPIILIVFIVLFSGILVVEYQKGTLINIITKGLKRWKIIASKTVVMVIFWTAGCLISYAVTYGYNAYFWDNKVAAHLFFSVFCFYLFGLWLITIILLASTLFRSAQAVTLSVGGIFLFSYLVALIPDMKELLPTHLMGASKLLGEAGKTGDYTTVLIVTAIWSVVNIMVSVWVFNRKAI